MEFPGLLAVWPYPVMVDPTPKILLEGLENMVLICVLLKQGPY